MENQKWENDLNRTADRNRPDFNLGPDSPGLSSSSIDRASYRDSTFIDTGFDRSTELGRLSTASASRKVCVGLGIAFVLIGLIGFGVPGFFGTHLSAAHNWVHLVSGALALYFGLKRSTVAANRFALAFGSVYGRLGLAGFVFGRPGVMAMPMLSETDRFLLPLIPGRFELGTNDHVLHLLIAAIFLVPAILENRRSNRSFSAPSGEGEIGYRH